MAVGDSNLGGLACFFGLLGEPGGDGLMIDTQRVRILAQRLPLPPQRGPARALGCNG